MAYWLGASVAALSIACRGDPEARSRDAGTPDPAPSNAQSSAAPVLDAATSRPEPSHRSPGVRAASYRLVVHATKDCPRHAYERLGPERRRFGVEVEITAAAALAVDPHFATLKDQAGNAYRATFGGCQPDLRYTRLSAGARARGWISFEIPAGARGFELSYNPHVVDAGRNEPVTTKLP